MSVSNTKYTNKHSTTVYKYLVSIHTIVLFKLKSNSLF